MKAEAAFEQQSERLRRELETARDMQQAAAMVTAALERTAGELARTQEDEQLRQRGQAIMAQVKRAPQLLCAARAEVREDEEQTMHEGPWKKRMIAGAAILGILAVHEMLNGQVLFALLQLAGGLLLGIGAADRAGEKQTRVRGSARADTDELMQQARALCRAADLCMDDLNAVEAAAGMHIAGTADEAMIDLMLMLMEAKLSGRAELAMRSLDQVQQALAAMDMETVMYDEVHAMYFDVLPTMGASRTMRPALLKDGLPIRRGVVLLAEEGGMQA